MFMKPARAGAMPGLRVSPGRALLSAALAIEDAVANHAARQQLARFDDRMLRDIGLTRAQAMQEAARSPFGA